MHALIQEIGDTVLEMTDTAHLFVKHYWKNKEDCLFNHVEVREMMLHRKSKKAHRTAPSEWTGNVGYSTRTLGNFGFCFPAPFTKGLEINDSCLVGKKDGELFATVQNLLLEKYPIFVNIFAQAGRMTRNTIPPSRKQIIILTE